jgi:hypothetical protein
VSAATHIECRSRQREEKSRGEGREPVQPAMAIGWDGWR